MANINYGWGISLFIQAFIAYHVFFLSKKLTNKARLKHKEIIKQKTEELLAEIYKKKLNHAVYLVNIKRYFKDYPSNKEKRFEGYSHIKAEIKTTRFDGVEFFSAMPEAVYEKPSGDLSFQGKGNKKVFNVFPVSIVPYEWIEHVDPRGDEYAYSPLFYCCFKGRTNWHFWKRFLFFGYPYKRTIYYKESDVYIEGNDPLDWKYMLVRDPISRK